MTINGLTTAGVSTVLKRRRDDIDEEGYGHGHPSHLGANGLLRLLEEGPQRCARAGPDVRREALAAARPRAPAIPRGFTPPTMGEDLLGDLERQASAELAQVLPEAQQATIEVTRAVAIGSPSQKIVETAEAEHVDLIVMATHGRTGLSHLLIGSVAERVVRTAPCPVLTIRPPAEKA